MKDRSRNSKIGLAVAVSRSGSVSLEEVVPTRLRESCVNVNHTRESVGLDIVG